MKNASIVTAATGLLLSVGVVLHEWGYRHDHPYAPGVSGVLIVLALGSAGACFAMLYAAIHIVQEHQQGIQHEQSILALSPTLPRSGRS